MLAGLVSATACFRSEIDVPARTVPGPGDSASAPADVVVHLTASPARVRTDGTPALITVVALAVSSAPASLTLTADNGQLSVAGSAASPSVDLPWSEGGTQAVVRLTASPSAVAGQLVTLTADAVNRTVVAGGDTEIPIEGAPVFGQTVTLGDEEVEFAAGWSVAVHWDFSAEYDYRPDDFTEDAGPTSNNLRAIVATGAPFPVGLAVAGGRSILLLPEGGAYTVHDYTPTTNNDNGPDRISAMEFVPNWPATGEAALYLGASSSNGGDGLYRVDPDWSIVRELTLNNVGTVTVDVGGAFDGIGSTVLYYATQGGLQLYPSTDPFVIVNANDCILRADPTIVCTRPTSGAPSDIRIIETVSHNSSYVSLAGRSSAMPVAAGLGPDAEVLVILDGTELVDLNSDATTELYLRSNTPGWHWVDVAVPPAGHPLATTPATFYLLEQNTALNLERVLRVDGPSG